MPVFTFRYTIMRLGVIDATDITDAAIQARKLIAGMPDAKLHDIIRTDPPLDPAPAVKPDAA